jgi:carbamate kinase
MKPTVVIALGGNAILQRGETLSAENQYKILLRWQRWLLVWSKIIEW